MATKAPYFTIASGATTSDALDMGAGNDALGGFCGFMTPATLTGTAFTFSVSVDDSTYYPLYNAGTQLSITVTTSRAYGFTADQRSTLAPWRFVKIVSGSAEGGARQIQAVIK
jgi:hypothetical protein